MLIKVCNYILHFILRLRFSFCISFLCVFMFTFKATKKTMWFIFQDSLVYEALSVEWSMAHCVLVIYVSLCWWNELWSLIKDLKEHIFHIIKCKRILTMEKLWLDKLTLWTCFLFNLTQYQRVTLLHHFFHCEKNTSFSGLFEILFAIPWIT